MPQRRPSEPRPGSVSGRPLQRGPGRDSRPSALHRLSLSDTALRNSGSPFVRIMISVRFVWYVLDLSYQVTNCASPTGQRRPLRGSSRLVSLPSALRSQQPLRRPWSLGGRLEQSVGQEGAAAGLLQTPRGGPQGAVTGAGAAAPGHAGPAAAAACRTHTDTGGEGCQTTR